MDKNIIKKKGGIKVGQKLSEKHRKAISLGKIGHKMSEESKKKLSESKKGKKKRPLTKEQRLTVKSKYRGENHPNWKGGLTNKNTIIRNSIEYKLWREAVFERDNWTCIWCGARSAKGRKVILHADHIKPFCSYPELRFSIDNGRTLCIDCHKTTDTYAGKSNLNKI